MDLDYDSHPVNLKNVNGGHVNAKTDVRALRKAIPTHCFVPSYATSLYYIFRDLCLTGSFAWAAYQFIPFIEDTAWRWLAWALYGWIEGLFFTGLWVLGHECGHGAIFPSRFVNDAFGFILHSALMTPYFSWKSTHRRHHIYANHMTKDLHYVPLQRQSYAYSLRKNVEDIDELTEDAPFFTLLRIILQQVVGWPFYLLMNITAPPTSLPKAPSNILLENSHFAPFGPLFHICLVVVSTQNQIGIGMILLLYLQPYLWLNHWIVAITYLHHTDPDIPKYEPEAWTFVKGATATIDRDFGFVGKYFLHGIIEFHVLHHLFSRIPFYHAEEATNAIVPLLGDAYHSRKDKNLYSSLWEAFTKCQWVESDSADVKPEDRALWFRAGPSPPPEYNMGKKLWTKMQ